MSMKKEDFPILSEAPPRTYEIIAAMDAIEARGEQPSPRLIHHELGEGYNLNFNGRDTAVYREHMEWLGYTQSGPGKRWRKM